LRLVREQTPTVTEEESQDWRASRRAQAPADAR
jgi:hypothetical protein